MIKNNLLKELKIINIGLKNFAESIKNQNAIVVEVEWKPPALGDDDLFKILESLK